MKTIMPVLGAFMNDKETKVKYTLSVYLLKKRIYFPYSMLDTTVA